MADILIPNMALPKTFNNPIQIAIFPDGTIKEDNGCWLVNTGKTAIELPSHGDLIPYHAVRKAIVNYFGKDNTEWCDMMDEIDKIDVVVEASNGSDN